MVIYKTINIINNKFYIGQDYFNNPEYYGSGLLLNRAIKKYGKENFKKEIIEICTSKSHLDEREVFWISFYDSTNRKIGYNITPGGTGGDTYSYNTDENKKNSILKRKATMEKRYLENPELQNIRSEKSRLASLKMWENSEHRQHMSDVMKGRDITWKDKIGDANRGKTFIMPEYDGPLKSFNHYNKRQNTISDYTKEIICKLYDRFGAKRIRNELLEKHQIDLSQYLIKSVLKDAGIYKKWKKGVGENRDKTVNRPFTNKKWIINLDTDECVIINKNESPPNGWIYGRKIPRLKDEDKIILTTHKLIDFYFEYKDSIDIFNEIRHKISKRYRNIDEAIAEFKSILSGVNATVNEIRDQCANLVDIIDVKLLSLTIFQKLADENHRRVAISIIRDGIISDDLFRELLKKEVK